MPPRKIDWAHWGRQKEVRLWEAVFLSLGANPELHPDYEDFIDDAPEELQSEIRKRLRTLADSLSDREAFTPGTLSMGDPNLHRVRLPEFSEWCSAMRYDIPSELAAMAPKPFPKFSLPAKSLQVDPNLQALDSEAWVCIESNIGGTRGTSHKSAKDAVAEIQQIIDRQATGFFTVAEAAQVIADEQGVHVKTFLDAMLAAFRAKQLTIRHYQTRLPHHDEKELRNFLSLVTIEDLNKWLAASGAGYTFPIANNVPVVAKPIPRTKAQNDAILAAIRSKGLDPKRLPKNPAGKPGIKTELRNACLSQHRAIFSSAKVFNIAWDRLRAEEAIADST